MNVIRVTPEHCRQAAQMLFPELWELNQTEAILKALRFLLEASGDSTGNELPALYEKTVPGVEVSELISQLRDHLARNQIRLGIAAKALGIHPVTLRNWLEGSVQPREENEEKVRRFIFGEQTATSPSSP